MSARKGKNLKRVKHQLKTLEEAFERDATARHKNISVRNALIMAQKCVDKQIGQKPLSAEEDNGEWYSMWYSCPQCAGGLCKVRGLASYCPNCGQKIDWEEVENDGKIND